jgi:hypothetical protein
MKALSLVIVGCVAAQGTFASTSERPQRTIPCGDSIQIVQFPYPGKSGLMTVLGAVSVPGAPLGRANGPRETAWPYFAKQGIVVKSGASVTITVPRAWRERVAISWGNNVHRVFHTIRIAACAHIPRRGYAYPGGFYLRRPSACVPLIFVVGGRRQEIWFGIGRSCR